MARRPWVAHFAAVLGYVLVAVAFSWPLLPNVATHLTGDPGGDTGVYVWNQWVFQHGALVEHRNPLTTGHIFSLTPRPVDLSQHNYTLFLNLLAMPLIGWLGTVATFNVVYLLAVVLTAWMTFVLARRVTEGATAEAWLAGLAFAWAPLLVARSPGTSAWWPPRRCRRSCGACTASIDRSGCATPRWPAWSSPGRRSAMPTTRSSA